MECLPLVTRNRNAVFEPKTNSCCATSDGIMTLVEQTKKIYGEWNTSGTRKITHKLLGFNLLQLKIKRSLPGGNIFAVPIAMKVRQNRSRSSLWSTSGKSYLLRSVDHQLAGHCLHSVLLVLGEVLVPGDDEGVHVRDGAAGGKDAVALVKANDLPHFYQYLVKNGQPNRLNFLTM